LSPEYYIIWRGVGQIVTVPPLLESSPCEAEYDRKQRKEKKELLLKVLWVFVDVIFLFKTEERKKGKEALKAGSCNREG
jgi:hypothetical protein